MRLGLFDLAAGTLPGPAEVRVTRALTQKNETLVNEDCCNDVRDPRIRLRGRCKRSKLSWL